DVARGAMNGFVRTAIRATHRVCHTEFDPRCARLLKDPDSVMGYHDGRDIPNYWTYAHDFVLQDDFFAGTRSWSLPAHLEMLSGWSAVCTDPLHPRTCRTSIRLPEHEPPEPKGLAYG